MKLYDLHIYPNRMVVFTTGYHKIFLKRCKHLTYFDTCLSYQSFTHCTLLPYSLAKEEELVAARNKAEELEKENVEMTTKLAKREQELDLRTQEKVTHFCNISLVPALAFTFKCQQIPAVAVMYHFCYMMSLIVGSENNNRRAHGCHLLVRR